MGHYTKAYAGVLAFACTGSLVVAVQAHDKAATLGALDAKADRWEAWARNEHLRACPDLRAVRRGRPPIPRACASGRAFAAAAAERDRSDAIAPSQRCDGCARRQLRACAQAGSGGGGAAGGHDGECDDRRRGPEGADETSCGGTPAEPASEAGTGKLRRGRRAHNWRGARLGLGSGRRCARKHVDHQRRRLRRQHGAARRHRTGEHPDPIYHRRAAVEQDGVCRPGDVDRGSYELHIPVAAL